MNEHTYIGSQNFYCIMYTFSYLYVEFESFFNFYNVDKITVIVFQGCFVQIIQNLILLYFPMDWAGDSLNNCFNKFWICFYCAVVVNKSREIYIRFILCFRIL